MGSWVSQLAQAHNPHYLHSPLLQHVEERAARTAGKKSLAMEAYAKALRAIPATICDNAGEPLLWP